MHALQAKKLTKTFNGVNVLDNISLSFERGKITGLVGPNGSGKTTFINIATGLLPADGGSLSFDHTEVRRLRSYDMPIYGVSRTFQLIRLFGQMTVLDNVLLALTERSVFASLFERHNKFHLEEAERVLREVELWDKRNSNAEALSYGQRKLLEIARVLATKSEVIFLDEPFAGLFPEMVKLVEKIVIKLRDEGKTIILVEHNMDIIRTLCDHLIVFDAGHLLAEGKPNEVLKEPAVLEAYLGE